MAAGRVDPNLEDLLPLVVTGWAAVAALIVPLAVVLGLLIIGKVIGDAIKRR